MSKASDPRMGATGGQDAVVQRATLPQTLIQEDPQIAHQVRMTMSYYPEPIEGTLQFPNQIEHIVIQ